MTNSYEQMRKAGAAARAMLVSAAAHVAKAYRHGAIKLLWTREDDIQGGYYRPMAVHRIKGDWMPMATLCLSRRILPVNPTSAVEGTREIPYDIPNRRVSWNRMESPVSVLWWRSVGHSHNAYGLEVFIDELLEKGGKDAIERRLAMMGEQHQREAEVLRRLEPGGKVQQQNWDSYRMLRIGEMPDIEVEVVESTELPTGVGEPGLPPLAPAVVNAWRRLGRETPRRLPIVAIPV